VILSPKWRLNDMGLFHCPVGCAYYEDEPCIDCCLCLATTEEERGMASKKIREYLRTRAGKRNEPSRKIAVCGKGGTGKTTIVVLLANAFLELGYGIWVLDTDESNSGLQQAIGFDRQPNPLIALRKEIWPGEAKPQATWFNQSRIPSQEIPEDLLVERGNLRFLVVGKISDPFQGCACSMADFARDFVARLFLEGKEILIIDTEAGIESFGRGVECGADTVLIAVEPSSESLNLAEKISYMAESIGIKKIRAILNKIPSKKIEKRIMEELEKKGIKIAGSIYLDQQISEASLEGKVPSNHSGAQNAAREIVKRILEETKEEN
jgi:CO dehydrogenase maturation factor